MHFETCNLIIFLTPYTPGAEFYYLAFIFLKINSEPIIFRKFEFSKEKFHFSISAKATSSLWNKDFSELSELLLIRYKIRNFISFLFLKNILRETIVSSRDFTQITRPSTFQSALWTGRLILSLSGTQSTRRRDFSRSKHFCMSWMQIRRLLLGTIFSKFQFLKWFIWENREI